MCIPHNPIFIFETLHVHCTIYMHVFLLNTVIKQLPSFETELVNSITDTKYFTIEVVQQSYHDHFDTDSTP